MNKIRNDDIIEEEIFCYDFTKSFDRELFENRSASDGILYRDDNGLTINSENYTISKYSLMDHIKWLTFVKEPIEIKSEEEVIYETYMEAEQIISPEIIPQNYRDRIRNINEDYRLCSAGIVVHDEKTLLTVMILLTNDWIYGYYGIDPHYKTSWCDKFPELGDYAAFTSIIPLCKRGHYSPSSCSHEIKLAIGISGNTISYYINDVKLNSINNIGYRLADQFQVVDYGGIPYIIVPKFIRVGFGNFSFIDHNIPNN